MIRRFGTKWFVLSAIRNARCPSNLTEGLFFAESAIKRRKRDLSSLVKCGLTDSTITSAVFGNIHVTTR
jgi:hypothetical protein